MVGDRVVGARVIGESGDIAGVEEVGVEGAIV